MISQKDKDIAVILAVRDLGTAVIHSVKELVDGTCSHLETGAYPKYFCVALKDELESILMGKIGPAGKRLGGWVAPRINPRIRATVAVIDLGRGRAKCAIALRADDA